MNFLGMRIKNVLRKMGRYIDAHTQSEDALTYVHKPLARDKSQSAET